MSNATRRRLPRRWRAGALVLLLSVLAATVIWTRPAGLRIRQEMVFDSLIQLTPAATASADTRLVQVVDIGATDEAGRPWDRNASARLAAALAAAQPAAVGWDVVFSGSCADALPATAALETALGEAPQVLGFLLSGQSLPLPPVQPAIAASNEALPRLWSAPGAEMPCPSLALAAAGLASVSLPGDEAARVRMVPAAVSVAGVAWPSLPVEVLRLANDLPTPLLAGSEDGELILRLPEASFVLDMGGTLRFRPSSAADRAARTLAAEAVLSGQVTPTVGAIILVGSSLPQRGGLRPTAADPLYPSVQISADLIQGLLSGRLPWRPEAAPLWEAVAVLAGGAAMAALMVMLPPLPALSGALALALFWALVAGAVHGMTGRLIDPVFPAAALVTAALAGLILQAAVTARTERALLSRMGQLLPGPVVARLVEDPGLLRLRGERREVTALFTDLEGFSATAATLPPEQLIAVLDRYFTVVSAQVLAQGGMIDKIVGDAVHALFNAPLDQPDHVDAALVAAAKIVAATEALRRDLGPSIALGRTRVGVETGPAILGDVGSGARIDYTAHGACVNMAARLQEAGKVLGPPVIIGPAAASQASQSLRALGQVDLRSHGTLALFTLENDASPTVSLGTALAKPEE
jgi:adenylate cyclase